MHTQRTVPSSLLLATLLSLAPATEAFAGDDNRPPREPPSEAFAACKDKQAGDTCQVVLHDAAIAGQCAAIPDGRLACRPDQPPPREPPAEAFAACKDQQAGNVCSVKLPDQTITGRCVSASDSRLFCLPDHMPQPPRQE
jgi:hypothetical protein